MLHKEYNKSMLNKKWQNVLDEGAVSIENPIKLLKNILAIIKNISTL